MSTAAAEPTSPALSPSGAAPSLLVGSLLGAVVILAGFVAAGFAAAAVPDGTPYLEVARIGVYTVVVAAAVFVGGFLAARNPAHGVSGGITLSVAILIATAFIAAALAANFKDGMIGPILAGVTLAAGGFGVFRLLTTQTGTAWCKALDDQGWTGLTSHKRTQGLLVRRCTMAGILLVGVTGAVAFYSAAPFAAAAKTGLAASAAQNVGYPPLTYAVPFLDGKGIPLVPVADLAIPALLALLTVWLAWRAVNVPVFGDFLIATEAEMNKVSWTPKKRLVQDTLVVLVFLLLLTLFLFLIDAFWSWLLSLKFIGVLPSKEATGGDTAGPGGKLPW